MEYLFTVIISTCDKFSDLWDANIKLLKQNWSDLSAKVLLVTDKPTQKSYKDVTIVCAGEGKEITDRLKVAMQFVNTDYVLFTLDDYFLTEKINTQIIIEDIKIMETHNLDYLRLFVMTKKSLRNRKAKLIEKDIYLLENWAGDYIVSLYAGIWRKEFMQTSLIASLNAWQYEVSLTKLARDINARCADSRKGEFPILDVIRKGKILNKAKKYLDNSNISIGNREKMKYRDEWMISLRTWLREWLPKPLFNLSKKIMRNQGMRFFSDEINN